MKFLWYFLLSPVLPLVCEQGGGIIPVAAVRQQSHDRLSGIFRLLRQFQCGVECCTGGNAYQNALMLRDQLCCCKRIIVLYFKNVIIDFGVQGLGYKSGTDTLNLVRTGLPA